MPSIEEEISTVEQELLILQEEQARCQAKIRSLMDSEDPVQGIFFPQEIHEARQQKVSLDFDIQFRKSKISRLRSGG